MEHESTEGPAPATRSEVAEIMRLVQGFSQTMRAFETASLRGEKVDGLTYVGTAEDDLPSRLAPFQARVKTSVWNMQPFSPFVPGDPWGELNDRSIAAGHDRRIVVSEEGLLRNPLLSSYMPTVRVGWVVKPMMVLDEAVVLYEGERAATGDHMVWAATRPDWVRGGVAVWRLCWGLARPALNDPESPPLNRRQYAVACFLAEGLGDEAIARRVGVSRRTVASDVRAVMNLLDAQTRFQAGIRLGSMKYPGRR